MNKTVLVIGSVTADQYQDARLSVLERGDKPKIIRVPFDEFFLGAQELLTRYATPQEAVEERRRDEANASADASLPLFHDLAIRHYASYGNIGAFVVDRETWDKWDASGDVVWVDHARMAQDTYANRWVAYAGGKVEFIG